MQTHVGLNAAQNVGLRSKFFEGASYGLILEQDS